MASGDDHRGRDQSCPFLAGLDAGGARGAWHALRERLSSPPPDRLAFCVSSRRPCRCPRRIPVRGCLRPASVDRKCLHLSAPDRLRGGSTDRTAAGGRGCRVHRVDGGGGCGSVVAPRCPRLALLRPGAGVSPDAGERACGCAQCAGARTGGGGMAVARLIERGRCDGWRLRSSPSFSAGRWSCGLLVTRRMRAAATATITGAVLIAGSWAAIGFAGLGGYPQLLGWVTATEASDSYSVAVAPGLRAAFRCVWERRWG